MTGDFFYAKQLAESRRDAAAPGVTVGRLSVATAKVRTPELLSCRSPFRCFSGCQGDAGRRSRISSAFFVNGDWQARWDSTGILPQAVEVTLVMDDFAELPRLFLVSKETAE